MFDLFDLPVEYKGKEMLFPAELLPMGFRHKIKVNVDGTDILFEPDEERNYRAVIAASRKSGRCTDRGDAGHEITPGDPLLI